MALLLADKERETEEKFREAQRRIEEMQQQLQEKDKQKEELLRKKEEEMESTKAEMEVDKQRFAEELRRQYEEQLQAKEVSLRERLEHQRSNLVQEREAVELRLSELEEKDKHRQEEMLREKEKLDRYIAQKESEQKMLEENLSKSRAATEESALATREAILQNFTELMEVELMCNICQELFIEATTLSCSHTFCAHCIAQWKWRQNTCPTCRTRVTSSTRSLVIDGYIDKMVENLSAEIKDNRRRTVEERKAEEASGVGGRRVGRGRKGGARTRVAARVVRDPRQQVRAAGGGGMHYETSVLAAMRNVSNLQTFTMTQARLEQRLRTADISCIVFLDVDNQPRFFQIFSGLGIPQQHNGRVPPGLFIWGFIGGKTAWVPPFGLEPFRELLGREMFHMNPRSQATKNAADFSLAVKASWAMSIVPPSTAFTMVTADRGMSQISAEINALAAINTRLQRGTDQRPNQSLRMTTINPDRMTKREIFAHFLAKSRGF